VQALECDRTGAARQLHAVGNFSDGAYGRELLLVPWDQQDTFLIADIYSECQRHAREDDCVFHRD
jgi:hypothetical protein